MMINQNTAVYHYGRRPALASHLPGHYSGMDLAGPVQSVTQLYMPGSLGAKAVGNITDQFAALAMKVIKTAFPIAGEIVSKIGDILDLFLKPMGNAMEAFAIGSATYLELPQAEAVLKDMETNRMDYVADIFYDCLYAFYRRIGSTGNMAKDIKEGRSAIIQAALGALFDNVPGGPIGRNSNRVANRVYTKAMSAGAKDWQAAAAVCYGVLKGFQTPGFPAKFKYVVKGVTIVEIGGGPDVGKPMFSLGNDFDALYFAKLGPVTDKDRHTLAWVEKQYLAKSGGQKGGTDSGKKDEGRGGGALPLLAVGALALLASR